MSDNQGLISILSSGSKYWNEWRLANPQRSLITGRVSFRGQSLSGLDLKGANLYGMDFTGATLRDIDFAKANLCQSDFRDSTLQGVDFSASQLTESYLDRLDLRSTNFYKAKLNGSYFSGSNLRAVNLEGIGASSTNFYEANLEEARLRDAALHCAELSCSNLAKADLTGAGLIRADLSDTDLTDADLTDANLSGSWLKNTIFCRTQLVRTKFMNAQLNEADFAEANLLNCQVHGISAWTLRNLESANQKNLIITRDGEPKITVDDLEIAQFIHILLNNQKIRKVIDTITSKVVLILGRFTTERKAILDALRSDLRARNYTPIIFDFEPSNSRDLTETISTLASMSRFIIADITDPKSIPQELQSIIPNFPSIPVQPLLQEEAREYAMFEHFRRYPWVLDEVIYTDQKDLIASIVERIIQPAEAAAENLSKNGC